MRKLARVVFVPALAVACVFSAYAQTPPSQRPQPQPQNPKQDQPQQPTQPVVIPCPQMNIQPPGRIMKDGEPITFTVNIGGGDPKVQPIYSWSVSAGTIVNGQGTRSISVDSTGAGEYRSIIADLLVGGYGYECNNRVTSTVQVAAPSKKVDEFGDLPAQDEAGKMDSIVNYLQQSPDRVWIIGYAGRNNVRGYAADVLRRMRSYLAKTPGIAERVSAVDGGFREEPSYEIWVVPVGSDQPRATPTVSRNEIVYPKTPPKTPTTKKP